jgi:hypothetical protein
MSRANDVVVPLALQLRTLTAFDGLLIIPRPTQSFGISLFAQPIGASHFLRRYQNRLIKNRRSSAAPLEKRRQRKRLPREISAAALADA